MMPYAREELEQLQAAFGPFPHQNVVQEIDLESNEFWEPLSSRRKRRGEVVLVLGVNRVREPAARLRLDRVRGGCHHKHHERHDQETDQGLSESHLPPSFGFVHTFSDRGQPTGPAGLRDRPPGDRIAMPA